MNINSLTAVQQRVVNAHHITTLSMISAPLPLQYKEGFASVSLYYLLHCLPGTMKEISIPLRHAASHLNSNGTLFGATVLGDDTNHNMLDKFLISIYNGKYFFCKNLGDERELYHTLTDIFEQIEMLCVGKVALFTGRTIRQQC
ncbi:SAM-dependent methyltransferase [Aeromonas sp. HMWF016]|uniref:SAM-dependent methyltransferase n=1 Tax=Aeromonas sp. HMWF016 TaxID=2056852 RepID=UPI0011B1F795|nr:SAM-dependent methyltransferase [Aeromonas sp. HMWF016]